MMMNMKVCWWLMLLHMLPLVGAQVPHWGPCPEPTTQPHFNLKQFMGRWFEISRLPVQMEKGGRCIETNFTLNLDGTMRVMSSEILKGEVKKLAGTAMIQDPKNPAKLSISFSYALPYTPYWILSTDYVNWAVVYSCTDILHIFHVEFAWILGRQRTLPSSAIEQGKQNLIQNHIDVNWMIPSNQESCD